MPQVIGDLLIITPQFVGCLLAVALLSLLVALWLARRRRRMLAIGAGLLALLLLPVTAADAVNAHYQYLPRVADVVNTPTWPTARAGVAVEGVSKPLSRPAGAVVLLPLAGPASGFGVHQAYVYLPPQYFTERARRFPVIYLLHGSPGAPIDWFRAARAADAGLRAARAGTPVILVAPRASRSWTDDSECVDRPGEHIETYLTVDVPTGIDHLLRTIPNRLARGVAGNSAGGYCALNLGLRHRDVFSGIVDLSGFDHPTFDGGMAGLFGKRVGLAAIVAANDPSQYASSLPARPQMRIWLDYGRSDLIPRDNARRMQRLLTRSGQIAEVHERPGGHDYGVWRPALQEGTLWMARQLTSSASQL